MRIILLWVLFFSIIWQGCKQKEDKIFIPDLRSNFSALLNRRDTTLTLDSFYFIRTDTMNEKEALTHQRFPFFNILGKINRQLEKMSTGKDSFHHAPSAYDLENIEYLKNEKAFVEKEIDSLNRLISHADSVIPIGYRAFYKVTVS